jgi:hypothetical protein
MTEKPLKATGAEIAIERTATENKYQKDSQNLEIFIPLALPQLALPAMKGPLCWVPRSVFGITCGKHSVRNLL